jgi:hypothetical protein
MGFSDLRGSNLPRFVGQKTVDQLSRSHTKTAASNYLSARSARNGERVRKISILAGVAALLLIGGLACGLVLELGLRPVRLLVRP